MVTVILIAIATGSLCVAAWQARRHERALRQIELERDIIRAAMFRGGRVSAIDVKTRQAATVAEIEAQLRDLERMGYCERRESADERGVYLFRAFDDEPLRALAQERQILLLAQIHNGRVSVVHVLRELDLSVAEARRKLDDMAEQRICARSGEVDVYTFYGVGANDAPPPPLAPPLASGAPGDGTAPSSGAPADEVVATRPRSLGGPAE